MNVLGWMHHKLRKSSIDPFKKFTIGNCTSCVSAQPTVDDQLLYPKPSHDSRPFKLPQRKGQKIYFDVEAKRVEEELEQESSSAISELFHGFLAIGTLGLEPIIEESPTPTFTTFSENITEKETKVTEDELKLISDELEKFLELEAKEEGHNQSSGRNSHVSIITLDDKQKGGADAEEHGKMAACPLQGYLFGSSIDLPDSRVKGKRERVSLGELFQMTKIADDHSKMKYERNNMQPKGKNISTVHLMKKMLKRLQSPSSPASSGDDLADSVSKKSKLHKVLQMFHRRIHPERSTAAKEFKKLHEYVINNTSYDGGYNTEDLSIQNEDNRRFPPNFMSEGVESQKAYSNLPQYKLSSNNSSGNREHWITTDSDCVLLPQQH